MEKVLKRIAETRYSRGFSYENMGADLNLSPSAYRKIEKGETKLTVERLIQIADILNTSVTTLLGTLATGHTTDASPVSKPAEKNEDFHSQKLTKDLLKTKDALIEKLIREIEFYRSAASHTHLPFK